MNTRPQYLFRNKGISGHVTYRRLVSAGDSTPSEGLGDVEWAGGGHTSPCTQGGSSPLCDDDSQGAGGILGEDNLACETTTCELNWSEVNALFEFEIRKASLGAK